ncbi:hypothetical protein AAVH_25744, partial [Aphelenchoides avenae]
ITVVGLLALLALVIVASRHHTIRREHYDAGQSYATNATRCHEKWLMPNGTSLHMPKSRPRRRAPDAVTDFGTSVKVITDPRRREFITKKINEMLSGLLRGVKIKWNLVDKVLPQWFVDEYYDEGVALGPSQLTKYVATEFCDRQVWKR